MGNLFSAGESVKSIVFGFVEMNSVAQDLCLINLFSGLI